LGRTQRACFRRAGSLEFASADAVGNREGTRSVTFSITPVHVKTKLAISGSAKAKVKKAYKLSGSITPATAGGKVTVRFGRFLGSVPRLEGTVTVALKSGRFSCSFTPRHKGLWEVTVSYAGRIVGTMQFDPSSTGRAFPVK